uniref:Uncharacterized protein n=1 Tax=Oryzias latipes TaxID=8090 RepID=A0A3B3IC91_ORYLA
MLPAVHITGRQERGGIVTFLMYSHWVSYCFTELEPTIYVLHFPNILVKNVRPTGGRHLCALTV